MNLWTVASYTLLEYRREKVIHVALALSALLIVGVYFLSELALSQQSYAVQSLALAATEITGLLLAVLGAQSLWREFKRKTALTLLAKPLARGAFWGGKAIALCGLMALHVFLATAVTLGALYLIGETQPWSIVIAAFGMLWLQLCLIVLVLLFCATWTSPGLAAFFSLGFWAAGHWTADLVRQAKIAASLGTGHPQGQFFAHVLEKILPDLNAFNLSGAIAYPQTFAWLQLTYPLILAACISLICVGGALWFMERKDFA